MAKCDLRMPPHPSGKVVETQTSKELWVGFVGHVPLVGTSANMVDGFISLLQGDTKTAEAKGYKDFLDAVGIHDLEPRSIFQSPINQTMIGCSAELSKKITDYILHIAGQKSQAKKQFAKAVQAGENLVKNLNESFKIVRGKLKDRGVNLAADGVQDKRARRGEHVFNNALLGLYGKIIDQFIEKHVTGSDRRTLVGRIPDSKVSDAFQGHAAEGMRINLKADLRRNIRTWVVDIPYDVVYIPVNNTLFEKVTATIRDKAVEYMYLYSLGNRDVMNVVDVLAVLVELMNTHRLYLDPLAVKTWFFENPHLISQFYTTEDGVQRMLRLLDPQRSNLLSNFVTELKDAEASFHREKSGDSSHTPKPGKRRWAEAFSPANQNARPNKRR